MRITILSIALVLSMIGCKHDPLPDKVAKLEQQVAQLQANQLKQEKYNKEQGVWDDNFIEWRKLVNEDIDLLLAAADKKPKATAGGFHDCHVTRVEHNGDFGDTIWRSCTDAQGNEHEMNY